MVTTILLLIIAICMIYRAFHKEPAFDIDETCWYKVRDKILKEDYAGVKYNMATSLSPVIIRHRNPLSLNKRHRIQKCFPRSLRIEFQEVDYKGEVTTIDGRGDFLTIDTVELLASTFVNQLIRPNLRYEKDKNGDWKTKLDIDIL